jgi:uncharacterized Rmd1/YagE family protein
MRLLRNLSERQRILVRRCTVISAILCVGCLALMKQQSVPSTTSITVFLLLYALAFNLTLISLRENSQKPLIVAVLLGYFLLPLLFLQK